MNHVCYEDYVELWELFTSEFMNELRQLCVSNLRCMKAQMTNFIFNIHLKKDDWFVYNIGHEVTWVVNHNTENNYKRESVLTFEFRNELRRYSCAEENKIVGCFSL